MIPNLMVVALSFTIESPIGKPCHERITSEAPASRMP